MAKQIYAVYDRVAQDIVGGLFVFTHDAPAIRIFVDGLNDSSTMLSKHPEDYALVCVGDLLDVGEETGYGGQVRDYPCTDAFHGSRLVLSGQAWKASQDAQENS